jgi:pyruvate dehydrogenase E1 component alpha subunit
VTRGRKESLPTLLEVRTYRFMGHSMSDPIHGHYRTKEEVEEQRKRDPIALWSDQLKGAKVIDDAGIKAMEESVMAEVMDSLKFAEESPDPDPSELWTDVYAGSN